MPAPLTAVIWDYDGTLVDTREKNYRVARRIVSRMSGSPPDRFPILRSLRAYERALRRTANWRELYRQDFGFSEEETDRAGALWSDYQREDDTPAELFDGIPAVLAALDGLPQGIVSQNARSTIARVLERQQVARYFRYIVGYEEVDVRRQKPEPDGLLTCLEELTGLTPGWVLYVGDHDTDVRCAERANRALKAAGRAVQVKTVGVHYGPPGAASTWTLAPDFAAQRPDDIWRIVQTMRGLVH